MFSVSLNISGVNQRFDWVQSGTLNDDIYILYLDIYILCSQTMKLSKNRKICQNIYL